MRSDFDFTVTSRFLGNVRLKPHLNTQYPPFLFEWKIVDILTDNYSLSPDQAWTFCSKLTPSLALFLVHVVIE